MHVIDAYPAKVHTRSAARPQDHQDPQFRW